MGSGKDSNYRKVVRQCRRVIGRKNLFAANDRREVGKRLRACARERGHLPRAGLNVGPLAEQHAWCVRCEEGSLSAENLYVLAREWPVPRRLDHTFGLRPDRRLLRDQVRLDVLSEHAEVDAPSGPSPVLLLARSRRQMALNTTIVRSARL